MKHYLLPLVITATGLLSLSAVYAEGLPDPGFELWGARKPSTQMTFEKAHVEEGDGLSLTQWAVRQTFPEGDGADQPKAVFTRDDTIRHEGASSLRITIPKPGGEVSLSNRAEATWHPMPFPIAPNRNYTLRGWIRTENLQIGGTKPGSVAIRMADNQKTFFSQGTERHSKRAKLPALTETGDWTPFEVRFQTGATDEWAHITLELPAEVQGTVWIDDLSLTEGN